MEIAFAVVLVMAALFVWALNLIGLPGNWLIIAVAVLYTSLVTPESRLEIGWGALVGMVVLATLGEGLEFLASALGASKAGGSKRGAALAMVGSLVGAFVGLFAGVAIPIPVVGSVIGALLCASLGALAGAVLGEQWKGRDLDESVRVGHAAFWGRLIGTVGKIAMGMGIIMLVVVALIF